MREGKESYVDYRANPILFTIKKWFQQLIGSSFANHNDVIERVASSLVTKKDLEDFGKMINQVYDSGYRKALEDYRSQIEKLGVKVTIAPPGGTIS